MMKKSCRLLYIISVILLFLSTIFSVFMFYYSLYFRVSCNIIHKPILYLYPQEKMNVSVTFDKEYLLETTYPKFGGSWDVEVYPDGSIYDKDGKYYYALYWDEKNTNNVKFNEGFYVEDDEAIEFLEEKLSIIGLNDRERNEFIMYWLPILEKNKKSLVYFELTEEKQKYNELKIEPKPDSLLRLTIHIKKVYRKKDIKEQYLPTFNRKGFIAVEWGGVEY